MIPLSKLMVVLLAGVLAMPAGFQEDIRQRIRTTSELVVVPVTVMDQRGNFVLDIRREEFRILEDEVEQQIELFSTDPFPLSAVVLIDNALQPQPAERVQQSLGAIAGGFGPSDEVMPCLFETFVEPLSDFVSDNDQLYTKLRAVDLSAELPGLRAGPLTATPRVTTAPSAGRPMPRSSTGRRAKSILDAVHFAAEALEKRPRDYRKIVLVISDGSSSGSGAYRFDVVRARLLAADVTVYAVGVSKAVVGRSGSVLARLAYETGGDTFYASDRAGLESYYTRVAEQARNQYTLAYIPRRTDRSRTYHSLDVRVRRPDLVVVARQGYFVTAAP